MIFFFDEKQKLKNYSNAFFQWNKFWPIKIIECIKFHCGYVFFSTLYRFLSISFSLCCDSVCYYFKLNDIFDKATQIFIIRRTTELMIPEDFNDGPWWAYMNIWTADFFIAYLLYPWQEQKHIIYLHLPIFDYSVTIYLRWTNYLKYRRLLFQCWKLWNKND